MTDVQIQMGENFQELAVHGSREFPIQYYADELFRFPGSQFPLHWHGETELFLALGGPVQAQIGRMELCLNEGDCIFVNSNVLHSFTQIHEEDRCRCPNIVFSGELIAPVDSLIYRRYIGPLLSDPAHPFVILRSCCSWQEEALSHLDLVFSLLQKYGKRNGRDPTSPLPFLHAAVESSCPEMLVQAELGRIWQLLYSHLDEIPPVKTEKGESVLQIRMQKMLSFIRSRYASSLTLDDIAASASISRSEASRCFQAYMNQPPVAYLLSYRLEKAKQLLSSGSDTIEEISRLCGFQSSGYFCRMFRKHTGLTPGQYRKAFL